MTNLGKCACGSGKAFSACRCWDDLDRGVARVVYLDDDEAPAIVGPFIEHEGKPAMMANGVIYVWGKMEARE